MRQVPIEPVQIDAPLTLEDVWAMRDNDHCFEGSGRGFSYKQITRDPFGRNAYNGFSYFTARDDIHEEYHNIPFAWIFSSRVVTL